jgi:hypothetical protein
MRNVEKFRSESEIRGNPDFCVLREKKNFVPERFSGFVFVETARIYIEVYFPAVFFVEVDVRSGFVETGFDKSGI